jgi:hypothetical protein
VVAWINAGELRATNLASNPNGKRPRWKIDRDDLRDFLALRATHAPTKPVRALRPKAAAGEKVFFE